MYKETVSIRRRNRKMARINKRTTKQITIMAMEHFSDIYVHEDGRYYSIDVYIYGQILMSIFADKKEKTSIFTIREDGFRKMIGGYGLKLQWKKAIRQFAEQCFVPFAKQHEITITGISEGEACLI
jgi:hypothetical protein